ncbi:DUF4142 domain-containing protein [Alsobacter sp. R-9]
MSTLPHTMRPPMLAVALALSAAACAPMPLAPMMSATPATTASSAAEFATMAAGANLFEIETSRVAMERASNPAVRRFADRMIRDHTRATQQMMAVLERSGMAAPPMQLDARHAAMLASLRAASGPAFDDAYLTMQAQAHREALALFGDYARRGDDPGLRRFASRTLPALRGHARMLERLGAPMS